jgi:hypothetical protein
VTALRWHHKIPVYRAGEEGPEPWLNLTKAAAHLQISGASEVFCKHLAQRRCI